MVRQINVLASKQDVLFLALIHIENDSELARLWLREFDGGEKNSMYPVATLSEHHVPDTDNVYMLRTTVSYSRIRLEPELSRLQSLYLKAFTALLIAPSSTNMLRYPGLQNYPCWSKFSR